ncbi:MAG TPA: caspase family protein [Xanthobacteraceae bacterium]|nr:caspase family protein [Xanthobacteraceae bacterium]
MSRFRPATCVIVALALAFALGLTGFATAWAATLRGPDGGEVRSLVIGIDAYKHVRPLKGAVADAQDIEGALRHVGVRDITTLLNDQADRASLMRALEKLVERTQRNDLVILSIAGHGTQEPERVKGSQPDGMDSVFLLPDFETTRGGSVQRVIGSEFNHFIKKLEAKGARVLFIADTCHGGGMARDIDPRAEEMSFRQVTRYTIPVDDLKPVSTPQEAFLTELDFERTAFLAAVDRKTKAPEVRVPGIEGFRGALSYAVARAFEGNADMDKNGRVTLEELFTNVREIVYQLSDQRQSPITVASPNRNIEKDVAFVLTRGVTVMASPQQGGGGTAVASAAPTTPPQPAAATPMPKIEPAPVADAGARALPAVRIASLDGQGGKLRGLTVLQAPYEIVSPNDNPDLVWDPQTGDVIVGGDVIAFRMDKNDLPSVIDRAAAVRGLKKLAVKSPQAIKLNPNDKRHHRDNEVEITVSDVASRALILVNIAGDGTVQALYPIGSDPPLMRTSEYRLPLRVREPFGADQVIAITSKQRMTELETALKQLNQRRTAVQLLRTIERYAPADARIGTLGLFTAP